MNKLNLLNLAILLMIVSTLSGCIWVEPIGYRDGGSYGGDRGNHRGNKH